MHHPPMKPRLVVVCEWCACMCIDTWRVCLCTHVYPTSSQVHVCSPWFTVWHLMVTAEMCSACFALMLHIHILQFPICFYSTQAMYINGIMSPGRKKCTHPPTHPESLLPTLILCDIASKMNNTFNL